MFDQASKDLGRKLHVAIHFSLGTTKRPVLRTRAGRFRMQAALLLKPSPFADVVQLVEALAQRRPLRRDRFRRVGGERALHEAGEFRTADLADAPAPPPVRRTLVSGKSVLVRLNP